MHLRSDIIAFNILLYGGPIKTVMLLIKHVHDNVSIPLQKCDNYSFSVLKYFRNPEFGGDVNILCGPKMMDFYKTILLSFVIMKKAILLVEPIPPKNSPRGTVTCK